MPMQVRTIARLMFDWSTCVRLSRLRQACRNQSEMARKLLSKQQAGYYCSLLRLVSPSYSFSKG
jgi:hypothetical protein